MNMPNQEYNEIESPKYKNEINPVKGEANVSISNVLRGPMLRIALKKRESPRPIPRENIKLNEYFDFDYKRFFKNMNQLDLGIGIYEGG